METKKYEQRVKERYAGVSDRKKNEEILNSGSSSNGKNIFQEISQKIGYSTEQINSAPEESNLGAGCGNPLAFSYIKKGDTVLDLGCGAGFDCFIASKIVGETGKVIGVDFTPEMIEKAKMNAEKNGYTNVEFILASIENIPLPGNSIDLIISNCVINLSLQKQAVLNETHRLLTEGGHLSISDMVLVKPLPIHILEAIQSQISCFGNAELKNNFLEMFGKAGFKNTKILKETRYPIEVILSNPTAASIVVKLNLSEKEIKDAVASILSSTFYAEK